MTGQNRNGGNNRGKHSAVWRCCTRVEYEPKKCDAPTIQESDLQDAVVKAVQKVLDGKDTFLAVLEKNIKRCRKAKAGSRFRRLTAGWKYCNKRFYD